MQARTNHKRQYITIHSGQGESLLNPLGSYDNIAGSCCFMPNESTMFIQISPKMRFSLLLLTLVAISTFFIQSCPNVFLCTCISKIDPNYTPNAISANLSIVRIAAIEIWCTHCPLAYCKATPKHRLSPPLLIHTYPTDLG